MSNKCCGLHVLSFGLALGVMWGVSLFVMALLALWFGYGSGFVGTVGELYIGYAASFLGSLVGLVWGFVDFFITGVIVAWLYNWFCRMCCSKSSD